LIPFSEKPLFQLKLHEKPPDQITYDGACYDIAYIMNSYINPTKSDKRSEYYPKPFYLPELLIQDRQGAESHHRMHARKRISSFKIQGRQRQKIKRPWSSNHKFKDITYHDARQKAQPQERDPFALLLLIQEKAGDNEQDD
jgi:hypothetical protein